MDDLDWKILRTLQAEPDLSINALADKVGLSHTPCWRRMKRLEDDGVIAGREVVLDPAKVGLGVDVFANVRISHHDEDTLEAFAAAVENQPQIVECFLVGGDSDYLLRVVTGSIEEYERFLKKVLVHMPGVAAVNSSFAMRRIKLTSRLPI
ncbi:Lrp/AsnC family transcriptional regulator [Croceicoccus naphthovorans]|uniref:AsnC family transcriptional regulator n=1 Tax=Croceicoccus naphthovorans TaxID=1348774 RepID=A0A0G3XEX6_9SPHN|nr:Lrp/AsnC family transcriptional regulator [Croceicoccus naphthovorans]AKM08943.1 AsnC family transcriptional regulator [Croceicoccus naphthovorans]MBB3989268.1 Lrp/AsnC family transcriptional regulator [Croceicoccus naphthovorans]